MKAFLLLILISGAVHAKIALPALAVLQDESRSIDWNKSVSETVLIEASLNEVWDYVSDSTRANEWSVFFDHISPLPGKFPDGEVGSFRRCFRMANESGARWDELTIQVRPKESRKIVTFNLFGFGFERLLKGNYMFVRQLYRQTDKGHTELTFQTIASPENNLASKFAFHISRKQTTRIFRENLENIKSVLEGYPRPYPLKL
jgi:hypothetical protein